MMRSHKHGVHLVICAATFFMLATHSSPSCAQQPEQAKPRARVIKLDSAGRDYQRVLGGPPETVSMRSGLVVLLPNQSVGKHSTKQNEELLIVLQGKGEMIFADGSSLPVQENYAVYCPPQTQHDVKNIGTVSLRYVYVVAEAK